MQRSFGSFAPPQTWQPPDLKSLPSWADAKEISFDCETRDETLHELGCGARFKNCYAVGYSFAINGGPAHYLPIRHAEGGNLDVAHTLAYLRDNAKLFRGTVLGGDTMYDLDYAAVDGITWHNETRFIDVLTTDSLIFEHHRSYTLDAVAERRGLPMKDETQLIAFAQAHGYAKYAERRGRRVLTMDKGSLWKLPGWAVGAYGEQDARLPQLIRDSQRKDLDDQKLWGADDLESRVLPITLKMRQRGVRIDEAKLENTAEWVRSSQAARLAQFTHATGIRVSLPDTRSPQAMASIIKKLGLEELPWTSGGTSGRRQPSIAGDTLESYKHPGIRLIQEARKLDTIVNTFIPAIRKHMVKGRIHATLKSVRGSQEGQEDSTGAAGTISRRFSCVHPNLQNQPNPGKDDEDAFLVELGTRWRAIFVPDEGAQWGLVDFSQQEPRWIVHHAAALNLRGAREMLEAFNNDITTDNHDMIAKITGLARGLAKIVFLARCYGAGMAKIAKMLAYRNKIQKLLGLPDDWTPTVWKTRMPGDWIPPGSFVGDQYETAAPEAEKVIRQFDEYCPYVKELSKICMRRGEERGYIGLPDGGRLRFETDPVTGKILEGHKGLNKLGQGWAAIQAKMAMVQLDAAGLTPQLAVHDDFSRSIWEPRELFQMRDICANAIKASLPFIVKAKIGRSYGEADSPKGLVN